MRLRYACSFSPNDVKAPTFRLLIPEWHDRESIESIVREIIDPEVDEDARTFFKSISFNQVHKGASRVFKEQFPARITAQMFPHLGIRIEAWSVKCQPIIDKEYRHSSQQAEAQRLELELERERRLVELAPIERLIQMYMIDGVPLQLLAWFAHQERGRGYRPPDLEQLRDVDIKQRARYVYRYVTEALGEDINFEELKDKIRREMYEPSNDTDIPSSKSPPPKSPLPRILQARNSGDMINQHRDK